MINILLGFFYISLIALTSYLLYYIIKIAIKDAYYELNFKSDNDFEDNKETKCDVKDE